MALVCKAFGDIITFTRASTATFTGSNGLIQSATTNTPRFDYDPVTLAAKGLLIEEQRTNLLTYSEDFGNAAWFKASASITTDAAVSPDGTTTADRLIPSAGVINGRIQANISGSGSAGTTYTLSVYGKADAFFGLRLYSDDNGSNTASVTYNVSTGAIIAAPTVNGTWTAASSTITQINNGWYRATLTWTATGAAPVRIQYWCTNTGDGTSGLFIWGAQLEAGAFATSYIPTVASQVTRSADVASVNTLSPWYNATEGTLYAEATPRISGYSPFAQIDDTTSSNRLLVEGGVDAQGFAAVGGVTQSSLDLGATAANTTAKIAFAYKANDFAGSLDGGAVVTDTSGTIPTVSVLRFGANTVATYSCHIRRITYYPRRLSNAELQAITA